MNFRSLPLTTRDILYGSGDVLIEAPIYEWGAKPVTTK